MIKELNTTLFQVQDYYDKTQLLAKGVSYYCGILYYRLDWLHEDIPTAAHHPSSKNCCVKSYLLSTC